MQYFRQALIRGIIPLIVMTGISLIMKHQKLDPFQIKSTFIVGLIITAVVAANVVYDIDTWSLTKRTVIHFILMLVTVFPCLLASGWFPLNNFTDYLKVIGIFLLVGLILWTFGYIISVKILKN